MATWEVEEHIQERSPVHNIRTEEDLDQLISGVPYVVVDFCAGWSVPCTAMMDRLFDKYAAKHVDSDRIVFAKIDVDELPDVKERYHVLEIPTIVFIRDGEEYEKVRGVVPPQLQYAIDGMVNAAGTDDANDDGNEDND